MWGRDLPNQDLFLEKMRNPKPTRDWDKFRFKGGKGGKSFSTVGWELE